MTNEATALKARARWSVRNFLDKMREVYLFTSHRISDDSKASLTKSKLMTTGFPIPFIDMERLKKSQIGTNCREASIWICQAVLMLTQKPGCECFQQTNLHATRGLFCACSVTHWSHYPKEHINLFIAMDMLLTLPPPVVIV